MMLNKFIFTQISVNWHSIICRGQSKIKALQNWFEKTQPAPPDFDPDQAKWEYLKEKHNL